MYVSHNEFIGIMHACTDATAVNGEKLANDVIREKKMIFSENPFGFGSAMRTEDTPKQWDAYEDSKWCRLCSCYYHRRCIATCYAFVSNVELFITCLAVRLVSFMSIAVKLLDIAQEITIDACLSAEFIYFSLFFSIFYNFSFSIERFHSKNFR